MSRRAFSSLLMPDLPLSVPWNYARAFRFSEMLELHEVEGGIDIAKHNAWDTFGWRILSVFGELGEF